MKFIPDFILVSAITIGVAFLPAATVLASPEVIEISLSGNQQSPPVENSSATGTIIFVYSARAGSSGVIRWVMDIDNPDGLGIYGSVGAHIHCGMPGTNGAVVVPLVVGGDGLGVTTDPKIGATGEITADILVAGKCVNNIPELWAAMLSTEESTSMLYVNVHSDENPNGEIRGDLKGGSNTWEDLHAQSKIGGNILGTPLSGEAVVPPIDPPNGSIGEIIFANSVYAEVFVYALDIDNPSGLFMFGQVGAHLHCGLPGFNGDIVVPFDPLEVRRTNDLEIGVTGEITTETIIPGLCYKTVPELWTAMTDNSGIYVMVHSQENPSGEIGANLGGLVPPPTGTSAYFFWHVQAMDLKNVSYHLTLLPPSFSSTDGITHNR